MPLDGGGEKGGEGGRRERVDLFRDLGSEPFRELSGDEVQVLFVHLAEGPVPSAPLEVQLLLDLIAAGVRDLVTETAQLDEVAAEGSLGDARTIGELEGVEAGLRDHHGKDAQKAGQTSSAIQRSEWSLRPDSLRPYPSVIFQAPPRGAWERRGFRGGGRLSFPAPFVRDSKE
jgi:hypothetical protein